MNQEETKDKSIPLDMVHSIREEIIQPYTALLGMLTENGHAKTFLVNSR